MRVHKLVPIALAGFLCALFPPQLFALSGPEVVAKVESSLVAVHAFDPQSGTTFSASGVVVRPQQVITSCSLVAGRSGLAVTFAKNTYTATLLVADREKELCLLAVADLGARAAERGSSNALSIQESVWAVGKPEATAAVESGVLTQLRGGKPPLIETTLLGTAQTVGRGVFDLEGRLIGITTVFAEGAQNLHFVAPVEWLDSLQPGGEAGGLHRQINWIKRAAMLEEASNWEQLRDLSRSWSSEFPEEATAWHTLGYACIALHSSQEAQAAFQQTIRINPSDIDGWSNLGFVSTDLGQFSDSVRAYQEVVRINPKDVDGWTNLSMAHEAAGEHEQAMRAVEQLRRLDESKAQELLRYFEQGDAPGFDDVEEHDHAHP
ncbi:MAG: trypsin-like peptidase domain-containing protein [Desulfobulbus sp.]|nr:trypsin-like peptidase domain-containing protein [Desulfobulbus sp.]